MWLCACVPRSPQAPVVVFRVVPLGHGATQVLLNDSRVALMHTAAFSIGKRVRRQQRSVSTGWSE
mgnify:CR=1 FL=1